MGELAIYVHKMVDKQQLEAPPGLQLTFHKAGAYFVHFGFFSLRDPHVSLFRP